MKRPWKSWVSKPGSGPWDASDIVTPRPVVIIENPDSGFPPIMYHKVNEAVARMLVKYYLVEGDPVFEHVLGATTENDMIPTVMDFPRFNQEKRLVLENCGVLDPTDIHDYIAAGGYSTLALVLSCQPSDIIREITESGLRGRGGAGFPTGTKWSLAAGAPDDGKVVICNADEGDPGAYMDRTILESNPHLILEGLAICSYAVGASRAIFYVRAEYPLAVRLLNRGHGGRRETGAVGPEYP